MAKSRLRDGTEPAVFVPEVAKQHDVLAGVIAFGVLEIVLVIAGASFRLDKKIRKLYPTVFISARATKDTLAPDCEENKKVNKR